MSGRITAGAGAWTIHGGRPMVQPRAVQSHRLQADNSMKHHQYAPDISGSATCQPVSNSLQAARTGAGANAQQSLRRVYFVGVHFVQLHFFCVGRSTLWPHNAGARGAALVSGSASSGFQDGYTGLLVTVRHVSRV